MLADRKCELPVWKTVKTNNRHLNLFRENFRDRALLDSVRQTGTTSNSPRSNANTIS